MLYFFSFDSYCSINKEYAMPSYDSGLVSIKFWILSNRLILIRVKFWWYWYLIHIKKLHCNDFFKYLESHFRKVKLLFFSLSIFCYCAKLASLNVIFESGDSFSIKIFFFFSFHIQKTFFWYGSQLFGLSILKLDSRKKERKSCFLAYQIMLYL